MHNAPRIRPSGRALLGLVFLAGSSAFAQTQGLVQRLDSLAGSGVAEGRAAGIVVAVLKGSDTLLMKGYGKADVEWSVPMPADAMFEIGSLTKQFTAAAMLQLRDEGKLSLDDEITKWLPDFDPRGNKLPLRRLLDHTSGIVGLTEMPEFGILSSTERFPRDSAYALIKRYPFQFPTGAAQVYNNSAFWLAGLIIEKASGMSYKDYIEKRIFAPLGMTHSMYCNTAQNVARRAHGYLIQGGTIRRAPPNLHTWPFAAGSLCSTAGDLLIWLTALHGGKVLSLRSYAEMVTPARLSDGTITRYAMGLSVGKDIRGLNVIGHGGSVAGFVGDASWYPDARLAVVVLMNSSSNLDPGAVSSELAGEILPVTRPSQAVFAGDPAPLLGKYQGPSRGRDMIVEVVQGPNGVAFSVNGGPARPLPWVDGWTFRQGNSHFIFQRPNGATGPATELRFASGGGYVILKRQ